MWLDNTENDTLFIIELYIRKRYRSCGYGTQTLVWVKKQAKKLKKSTVSLNVFTYKEHAKHIYTKAGFTTYGEDMLVNI